MDYLIRLSSMTEAMRSRDILRNYRINSYIKRVPATPGKVFCGYGIVVSNNADEAVKLLTDNGIQPLGRAVGDKL